MRLLIISKRRKKFIKELELNKPAGKDKMRFHAMNMSKIPNKRDRG